MACRERTLKVNVAQNIVDQYDDTAILTLGVNNYK